MCSEKMKNAVPLIWMKPRANKVIDDFKMCVVIVEAVTVGIMGYDSASNYYSTFASSFLILKPPSYPNQVRLGQWGPLSSSTNTWKLYNPNPNRNALARQPCSTKTSVPTDVPVSWPT